MLLDWLRKNQPIDELKLIVETHNIDGTITPTSRNEIRSLVESLGLRLWEEHMPTEDEPYELIWTSQDRLSAIHFIEDLYIPANYMIFTGNDCSKYERLCKELFTKHQSSKIIPLTPQEALGQYQNIQTAADPLAKGRTLCKVAVLASDSYAPNVAKVIEQAAKHSDPHMRRAAITAIGYIEWKELDGTLQKLTKDPDFEVRQDAQARWEMRVD